MWWVHVVDGTVFYLRLCVVFNTVMMVVRREVMMCEEEDQPVAVLYDVLQYDTS